jgi:type II secretory pathway pseudopilin PulG
MIELVIVVMVMSILAAVSAPAFIDSLLFHRVESAARRVKVDLELARQNARLTSAARSVSFTSSGYTLSSLQHLDKPSAAYIVNLTASPYQLDSAAANFANSQVVSFDAYGTPSSGGTVVLAAKNHQCIVTLNGSTGAVTIGNHSDGRSAEAVGN